MRRPAPTRSRSARPAEPSLQRRRPPPRAAAPDVVRAWQRAGGGQAPSGLERPAADQGVDGWSGRASPPAPRRRRAGGAGASGRLARPAGCAAPARARSRSATRPRAAPRHPLRVVLLAPGRQRPLHEGPDEGEVLGPAGVRGSSSRRLRWGQRAAKAATVSSSSGAPVRRRPSVRCRSTSGRTWERSCRPPTSAGSSSGGTAGPAALLSGHLEVEPGVGGVVDGLEVGGLDVEVERDQLAAAGRERRGVPAPAALRSRRSKRARRAPGSRPAAGRWRGAGAGTPGAASPGWPGRAARSPTVVGVIRPGPS